MNIKLPAVPSVRSTCSWAKPYTRTPYDRRRRRRLKRRRLVMLLGTLLWSQNSLHLSFLDFGAGDCFIDRDVLKQDKIATESLPELPELN